MWQRRAVAAHHAIFSAEHEELRGAVRRFVDAEVRPEVDAWERAGYFPDALFRRCGELGFLGLHYPARYGGSDGDLATGLVFVEELARCGAAAIPMAISVQIAHGDARARGVRHRRPAQPVARSRDRGREDRRDRDHRARRRFRRRRDQHPRGARRRRLADQRPEDVHHQRRTGPLPHARGRRPTAAPDTTACHCSSSTPRSPACRCRAGSRSSACTRPTPPRSRSTTSLVPHADLDRARTRSGIRAADVAAAVRAARRRGRVGRSRRAGTRRHDRVRAANARRSAGRSREHQVIAHKLADAATELEAARALLYSTAWRVMHDEYPVTEISMTKKYCAQVQNRLVDTCLQVFGGAGYLEETPVAARLPRRALAAHRRRHRRDHERGDRQTPRAVRTEGIGETALTEFGLPDRLPNHRPPARTSDLQSRLRLESPRQVSSRRVGRRSGAWRLRDTEQVAFICGTGVDQVRRTSWSCRVSGIGRLADQVLVGGGSCNSQALRGAVAGRQNTSR